MCVLVVVFVLQLGGVWVAFVELFTRSVIPTKSLLPSARDGVFPTGK